MVNLSEELKDRTYVVGGCVRDVLLGKTPQDFDFVVVGATPTQMTDLGFDQVGADFPVFLHPETGSEFALARTERKTNAGYDGFECFYDPSVTLEDDLKRRDLTINAMAVKYRDWVDFLQSKDTHYVIDYHDGLADLKFGRLRHVSEAFAEDPLRSLRVARFAARYNYQVTHETALLMKKLTDDGEIHHLTAERVWAEFRRSIEEPYFERFLKLMDFAGVSQIWFPEVAHATDLPWIKRASLLQLDPIQVFGLLCVDCTEEEVIKLTDRLKAPIEYICFGTAVAKIMTFLNKTGNRFDTDELVDFIASLDAWRQPKRLVKVCQTLQVILGPPSVFALSILETLRLAVGVSFHSLTPQQQTTLRGREISDAIMAKRKEVVGTYYANTMEGHTCQVR